MMTSRVKTLCEHEPKSYGGNELIRKNGRLLHGNHVFSRSLNEDFLPTFSDENQKNLMGYHGNSE